MKLKEMSDEERTKLEQEMEDIKKILLENESVLKALHGEYRKTASLAGIVFLICLALYCVYAVYANPN